MISRYASTAARLKRAPRHPLGNRGGEVWPLRERGEHVGHQLLGALGRHLTCEDVGHDLLRQPSGCARGLLRLLRDRLDDAARLGAAPYPVPGLGARASGRAGDAAARSGRLTWATSATAGRTRPEGQGQGQGQALAGQVPGRRPREGRRHLRHQGDRAAPARRAGVRVHRGQWVDPPTGRSWRESARQYAATPPVRTGTAAARRRVHPQPRRGHRRSARSRLVAVRADRRAGVGDRPRERMAPTTLRALVEFVRAVFAAAVADHRIARSPFVRISAAPPRAGADRAAHRRAGRPTGADRAAAIPGHGDRTERPRRCGSASCSRCACSDVDFLRRTVRVEHQIAQAHPGAGGAEDAAFPPDDPAADRGLRGAGRAHPGVPAGSRRAAVPHLDRPADPSRVLHVSRLRARRGEGGTPGRDDRLTTSGTPTPRGCWPRGSP